MNVTAVIPGSDPIGDNTTIPSREAAGSSRAYINLIKLILIRLSFFVFKGTFFKETVFLIFDNNYSSGNARARARERNTNRNL